MAAETACRQLHDAHPAIPVFHLSDGFGGVRLLDYIDDAGPTARPASQKEEHVSCTGSEDQDVGDLR